MPSAAGIRRVVPLHGEVIRGPTQVEVRRPAALEIDHVLQNSEFGPEIKGVVTRCRDVRTAPLGFKLVDYI